ncbi:MAG: NUDIX domain-containing protein [Spirochaetes bacterium]|nr:NUDIX domain-containing protein [Spirochaetota bacterium]
MSELWDVYTKDRKPTGRKHQRGQPIPSGDYHIAVLIWVVDSAGNFIITKRHPDKPWGGYWECTGGSVTAGEDSLTGAVRELAEETGFTPEVSNGRLVHQFADYDTLFDVWLFRQDFALSAAKIQQSEVTDIRKAGRPEILAMLADESMVPTLRESFQIVCRVLDSD